jgi:hypothetical protein
MSDSQVDVRADFFDTVARVLLRCWLMGFALVLLVFGAYELAGGFIHRMHGGMFGLTAHELDVIFYCAMGFIKLCVLVFFLIPWAAIRLTRRTSGA